LEQLKARLGKQLITLSHYSSSSSNYLSLRVHIKSIEEKEVETVREGREGK
jgi:putative lipoic acid-binding regulatory protein